MRIMPYRTLDNIIDGVVIIFVDIAAIKQIEALQFNEYKIEHDFPKIGRRVILLNARRIMREDIGTQMILLAMEDITEGFERSGTGEFIQFLAISKGSAGEVKSQLYVAVDQSYISKEILWTIIYIFPTGVVFIIVIVHISEEKFERLFILATEVNKMIGGLMNYLRKSKIKGIKYKST